jgi:hypothetical protein
MQSHGDEHAVLLSFERTAAAWGTMSHIVGVALAPNRSVLHSGATQHAHADLTLSVVSVRGCSLCFVRSTRACWLRAGAPGGAGREGRAGNNFPTPGQSSLRERVQSLRRRGESCPTGGRGARCRACLSHMPNMGCAPYGCYCSPFPFPGCCC